MRTAVLLTTIGLLLFGADAKEDEVKKELKKLEGNWKLVTGERDGTKLPDEHVKQSKIAWKGKSVSVVTPHQSKETIQAETTVDPGKTPKQMDWLRSSEPGKGKTMHAIYEWQGDDQYRVCFSPPEKERPKNFTTKPGSGQILHVWKRVKDK